MYHACDDHSAGGSRLKISKFRSPDKYFAGILGHNVFFLLIESLQLSAICRTILGVIISL